MASSPTTGRYDDRTIRYHWLTVALIVVLWGIAQVIDDFPRGLPRVSVRSVHIVLGLALAALLVARLRWRFGAGTRLPAAPGIAGRLAAGTQHLLYLLLVVTLACGVANVLVRGDSIFGLFRVPSVAPGNDGLRETVEHLHGLCVNLLLILGGLHALSALGHQFLLKDGLLDRMRRAPRG